MRSGHAYAQGFMLHCGDRQGYCLKPTIQAWVWGFFLPLAVVALSFFWTPWALLLAGLYGVQFFRVYLHARSRGKAKRHALLYASFIVLAKFPQLQGQIIFWHRRLTGTVLTIIEYDRC